MVREQALSGPRTCAIYLVSKWIKGLKREHGLDLDAIAAGQRERSRFSQGALRATLMPNGLEKVKLHGFDKLAKKNKFDWVRDMAKDPA